MKPPENLVHALNLAREDIWFLLLNTETEIPPCYIWRVLGTAEFITKNLEDREKFDPFRDAWIQAAVNSTNQREIVLFLKKNQDRYRSQRQDA